MHESSPRYSIATKTLQQAVHQAQSQCKKVLTLRPIPLIWVGSTLRALSRALPCDPSSDAASVKRDKVTLRLMLSQSPCPMNFGGSGALVLRRFSFRLILRPRTPAAALQESTVMSDAT